ncbi:hypothetical protein [Niallia sp. Marseille-Q9988]
MLNSWYPNGKGIGKEQRATHMYSILKQLVVFITNQSKFRLDSISGSSFVSVVQ